MVRIGIVGIGFMGYTHFEAARKLAGGRVAAVASRSEKKLAGDWTGIQGNFGPPAGHVDLSQVKKYREYQELLADPDIDLVDVCLPTDLHEKVVLEALAAGKHVLVEKPIAIDLAAADRMVEAAERAGRLLMVGQVLPYFPEFRYAAELIASGEHGKLLAAHFRRIVAPPKWSSDMADFRNLGGWGIDLHIHDNHFLCITCGVPSEVFSRGLLQDGFVNHVHSQYVFAGDGPAVSCVSGGIAAPAMHFAHGFELYFERATLYYDAGTYGKEPAWVETQPIKLFTADGDAVHPKLKGGSEWCAAFTVELEEACNGVKEARIPATLSGALARDALKLCYAEAESIRTGKPAMVV
ncbi:MAG: Gfo/Idh/MocA family oxidoreductase [Planctomycetales bacterium]